MKPLKQLFLLLLLCLCLAGNLLGCTTTPPDTLTNDPQAELVSLLRELSLYGLPEDFSSEGLTPLEIVAALEDPYAAYFTAEEFQSYESDLQGNFVGIGVSIVSIAHPTYGEVIQVLVSFDGSPAKGAGITAGDILTHVDGVSIDEMGYDATTKRLLGEAGTPVTITFVRERETHTVTLNRAACVKQTVFHHVFPSESGTPLGYVRITDFDAVTTHQFITAIESLKEAQVAGVVFDLRYNGGGYLRTVCEMLAYILPDGVLSTIDYHTNKYADYPIFSQNGALYMGSSVFTGDSLGNPILASHSLDLPMAVLTNGSTASAAELFTAALRDYGAKGTIPPVSIFGETTFGKGCMQSTYRLSDGGYVKLTIALYNPPTGANYDGIGITPTTTVTGSPTFVDLYLSPLGEDPVRDAALTWLTATPS